MSEPDQDDQQDIETPDTPPITPWRDRPMAQAMKRFGLAALELPRLVVFNKYVISVLALSAAYGLWHQFYPAAAERNAAHLQNGVDAVAETVTSWVRALKAS